MKRYFLLLAFLVLLFGFAFAASCDNGTCEAGENQCSCPSDCGKCEGAYGNEACRELACVSGVCKVVEKAQCCGNAKCESSENYSSCPADCMPKTIDIAVVFPTDSDYAIFGETVTILVDIKADNSTKVIGAEVTVDGPFKKMPLYNDGMHSDGTAFDSVYGNFLLVTPKLIGANNLDFKAVFRGITGEASAILIVRPDLNVLMDLPEEAALGDVLELNGKVLAKAVPVQIPLDANIIFDGKAVFNRQLQSDAGGNFSFSYPISLLSKLGAYTLSIVGFDENGNRAFFEKGFEVKEKVFKKNIFVSIAILPKEKFLRGEEIPVIISIVDDQGTPVEKAEAFVSGFGESTSFFEFESGKYSASITVPFEAVEGENTFKVSAYKKEGNAIIGEAGASFVVVVEKAVPVVELVMPKEDSFNAGDTIEFDVLAKYPNDDKVTQAEVFVLIGSSQLQLVQTEPGRFSGKYFLTEADYSADYFSVKISDDYGNVGSLEKEIKVYGATIPFVLARNLPIIVAIVVIIAIIAFFFSGLILGTVSKVSKTKKVSGLEEKLKELQVNYFKKSIISRPQYESESQKIKEQLRKAKGG